MNAKKPAPVRPLKPDHPGAGPKSTKQAPVPFTEALTLLRAWRQQHPESLQLDGHPTGRNHLKPWLHVTLAGFSSPRHDFRAKHSLELITGNFYNGTWNFHADTKAKAVDRLLQLCSEGQDPLDFLIPTATHEAKAEYFGDQNPKLTLVGASSDEGLYLYQS